jgi:hypothetical protein
MQKQPERLVEMSANSKRLGKSKFTRDKLADKLMLFLEEVNNG